MPHLGLALLGSSAYPRGLLLLLGWALVHRLLWRVCCEGFVDPPMHDYLTLRLAFRKFRRVVLRQQRIHTLQ